MLSRQCFDNGNERVKYSSFLKMKDNGRIINWNNENKVIFTHSFRNSNEKNCITVSHELSIIEKIKILFVHRLINKKDIRCSKTDDVATLLSTGERIVVYRSTFGQNVGRFLSFTDQIIYSLRGAERYRFRLVSSTATP